MKKIKVLYCVSSISSIGGISKLTVDKANYLVKNGFDVTIVTTEDYKKDIFYPIHELISFYELDINYKSLWKYGIFKRIYSLIKSKRLHKSKLKKIIENKKPDIIIDTCGFEIPFLNKIKGNAKIIHEIHSHKFSRIMFINKKNINFFKKILFKMIAIASLRLTEYKLKDFEKVIVLTDDEKKCWKYLNNVDRISNFLPTSNIPLSTCQNKQVITAGRLSGAKGYTSMINIWKNINKKYPDWQLVIYGSGEKNEYDKIIKSINKFNLANCILVKPSVPNILEKFSESSIFITTSQLESFGMTIIEAQSVGLPVVAYNCPTGPASIINHKENGYLVDLNNESSFCIYLEKLINSEELRLKIGKSAYENTKRYTENVIMNQWIYLFNELVKEKV